MRNAKFVFGANLFCFSKQKRCQIWMKEKYKHETKCLRMLNDPELLKNVVKQTAGERVSRSVPGQVVMHSIFATQVYLQ